MSEAELPSRASLPIIWGTQIGLRDSAYVDQVKEDMRMVRFDFQAERGRIAGVRDPRGTYYVMVGHHRVVAALELYRETQDATAILQLLYHGKWDPVMHPPNDRRPLPFRDWWGKLRNRLGF